MFKLRDIRFTNQGNLKWLNSLQPNPNNRSGFGIIWILSCLALYLWDLAKEYQKFDSLPKVCLKNIISDLTLNWIGLELFLQNMTGNAARIWNYGSAPWQCTKPKFLLFIRLRWHELYMNSNGVQHFSKNIPALLSDRNSFLYVSLSGSFIAGCMKVSYFAYVQIVNDRTHFFGSAQNKYQI